jgi:hypothetical protein
MNILTDIALVVLPIPMMWKIQISWRNKAFILGLFAIRLMLVYCPQFFPEPISDQEQCTCGHRYSTRLPLPLLQLSQRPNLVQHHPLDSDSSGDEHQHNCCLHPFPSPRRDRAPYQPDRHHRYREYGTLHGGKEGLRHRRVKAQWVVDGKVQNQRFGSRK